MFYLEKESLSYGNKLILSEINLEIKEGEKVAVLGGSGSGKSTLLKRLYEIKKEKASYIPQELGLVNNLSVFHNVYISSLDNHSTFYNIRNLIKPIKKEVAVVSNILKEIHLEDLLFNKVNSLSGGQKQRTAIARAILSNKEILLADEPISALDEFLTKKVTTILKYNFKTVVCALHNVDIALNYFDRVIGIKDGQIVLDKKCSDITKAETTELYNVCK